MDASRHVVAGLREAARDRADLALDAFARALDLDPHHVPARQARAATLMGLGRYDDALADARVALIARHGPEAPPETWASAVKLRHDIEQLRHLAESGLLPAFARDGESALAAVLAELAPHQPQRLSELQKARIGGFYNRLLHLDPGARVAARAVSEGWTRDAASSAYAQTRLAVVDGFLTPQALAALRRFCLDSTIWFDATHVGGGRGYIGADGMDGFACPLLFQIAEELRCALPGVIGPLPLTKLWAFKYDSSLQGIAAHADAAQVNVNFWLTPDEANRDPAGGGMVVHDAPVPEAWDFQRYNADPSALMRHVRDSGARAVTVPHRQNRAVIFDSGLVHATAPLRFRAGYANRRINVTLLFGHRR